MAKVEQRVETTSIPSPRQPAVDSLPDDEIDSDVPVAAAPAPAETEVDDGLGERELAILAFERQSWRHAGAKEQAIRDRFELSATRYYQLLNALLDNPAALAHDPVLVGRLRRLRGSRARARGR
jgi:hypothetical protein